jgi:hypothetical protein
MSSSKWNKIIVSIIAIAFLLPGMAETQRPKRKGPAPASKTVKIDTLLNDSTKKDSLSIKKNKNQLNAPVNYEAEDSIVFTRDGYAHLYGNGKVTYQKTELDAQIISMNMDSSTVYARGVPDSTGTGIKGKPEFKDGDTPYDSNTIRYNFKTKKGFISDVVTQQGEGYVTGNNAKKGANDELYMNGGKYTTCDLHEHPHFYMQMTRAKVRPKKNIVTGPAYLVVEDVPLPIAVPFFFFPFSSKYSSGFIMPTYMDDSSRGFGLTGGGYYFAINDYMDLKLTGDIYTKGSWAISALTNYNKRYKFSGSLQADYQVTKTGDKGLPDYAVAKDFKVVWSHRQDTKASPNSTFSASVNFATSSYERSNVNNLYNSQLLTQNTKTSSISYSRNFPEQNLSLSSTFNIAQTLADSSIAITLPDLNVTLSHIYPFKRKNAVGDEKWYEKIALSYTGRFTNSIKTKDNKIFSSSLTHDWINGANHNIPISATFTLFKYINVTPSISYTERWYTRKIMREYDATTRQLTISPGDTIYGFHRVYNYSASLGLSTKLYGFYKPLFMKSKDITIRHVFTPTVSISAAPDFGSAHYGYWKKYIDAYGNEQYYSPYAEQPFGVPGRGKQGAINFDMSNNIEAKYKAKNDSIKKISIIDELGASMSYNMAAETKPWSDLSTRLRLKLGSYTFNMNASFATYAYQFDSKGNVYVGDRTEWSYGRFGRFQGYGSSFSYTLNNDTWKKLFGKDKDKQDENDKKKTDEENSDDDPANKNEDPNMRQKSNEPTKQKAKVDANGYEVFNMPWSLSLNYSFNISENTSATINKHTMRYPYKYTHNLNVSGNLKLSNKWQFNFTSGYDFQSKKITQTAMTISRDLHCFTMTCSLSPFGTWKYYNFTIRASASILQDLKWQQRSQTRSNIEWY